MEEKYHILTLTPFFAGCIIMSISGTIYLYSIYSDNLEDIFDLNEDQKNNIGNAFNAGTWGAIIPGFFYDKWGPKLTALVGAMLVFFGYFCLYMASLDIFIESYGFLLLYAFIAGHGSAWTLAAGLLPNVANFKPEYRGTVVGVTQACFSLSAGLMTQFYYVFFEDNVKSFLLFMSLFLSVVALICSFLLHKLPSNIKSDYTAVKVKTILKCLIVLALFIAFGSIVNPTINGQNIVSILIVILYILVIILLLFLSIKMILIYPDISLDFISPQLYKNNPVFLEFEGLTNIEHDEENDFIHNNDDNVNNPLHNNNDIDDNDDNKNQKNFNNNNNNNNNKLSFNQNDFNISSKSKLYNFIKDSSFFRKFSISNYPIEINSLHKLKKTSFVPRTLTLKESLQTIEFWLLFLIFAVGIGSAITILDNIDEIVDSLSTKPDDDSITLHETLKTHSVTLFSACNGLGRIFWGFNSDKYSHIASGYIFLFLIVLGMTLTQFFFTFISISMIYPAIILAGLFYGGFWASIPTLTAFIWGTTHYGAIHGAIDLGATFGSELLYAILSTEFYEIYEDDEGGCYHRNCFRYTFLITTLCGIFALILCAILEYLRKIDLNRIKSI